MWQTIWKPFGTNHYAAIGPFQTRNTPPLARRVEEEGQNERHWGQHLHPQQRMLFGGFAAVIQANAQIHAHAGTGSAFYPHRPFYPRPPTSQVHIFILSQNLDHRLLVEKFYYLFPLPIATPPQAVPTDERETKAFSAGHINFIPPRDAGGVKWTMGIKFLGRSRIPRSTTTIPAATSWRL